ncbi:NAD(P)/FAD-dependent oxidoreductase [Thermoflexus hugenholtzii]
MGKRRRPRIVVVGAGFGGLWAVRTLAFEPVEVLLVDRRNHHTFFPLLYQVAAAEIEPEAIAFPIRGLLRRFPNVGFEMAEVRGIDLTARRLETDGPPIDYDFLILAPGSVAHTFGVPGVAEHAFFLKDLDQAVALRNHILSVFERAAREPDPLRRRRLLTFVIVGGGPTGVEFAGALAELIARPLRRDFPSLDFREVRVLLLEAMEEVLPGLPAVLSAYARERLRHLGVEVRRRAPVAAVGPDWVRLQDGEAIETATVVWTAGVRGHPLGAALGLPLGPGGRAPVTPTLQVPGHPEIYVVGDLALPEGPGRLPMVAPVAIQQGTLAARNILRALKGRPPLPFRYRDPGTLVTIGRNAAVAHVFGRAFTGFAAWLLWLGVHLIRLIGMRNRLVVLSGWAWDYLFYERAVRLILPSPPVRGK